MKPWGEEPDARESIGARLHRIVFYGLAAVLFAATVWGWVPG